MFKFEGCYHGHFYSLLSRAVSCLSTFNLPYSAGVPEEFVAIAVEKLAAIEEAYAAIAKQRGH